MSTKTYCRLIGIFMLVLVAASSFGQTVSSTIAGTVVDPASAVIQNAQVTLTEKATGSTFVSRSNEAGLFRFVDRPPGGYSLRIQAAGFKVYNLTDIQLASSETRDLGPLTLQLGATNQEISVTAAPTPVQTGSSERGALIDGHQLNDIALKGRDPFGYLGLLPGVVDTNTSRDLAQASSISGIQINGAATGNKNVTFDGVSGMDSGGNNSAFTLPNPDSIAEVRVISNAFQAQYGRQAAGTIDMVTKNGTNVFHGSGYWNRRHEDMNANTFFNNRSGVQRPIYRYFIGGYSIGGPAYIPKVWNTQRTRFFFFASEEFTRVALATSVSTANLPTTLERSGNFSQSLSSVGKLIPIIDPTTGAQFPGNIIPASRITTLGQGILNLFPLPNGYVNPAPGQQYSQNFIAYATPTKNRRGDVVRLDGQLTDRQSLTLKASRDVDNTQEEFVVGPGLGGDLYFHPGYQFSAHYTYTISPTVVNQVTVGLGHDNVGKYHLQPDSTYFRTPALDPPTLRTTPLTYCTGSNQSCWSMYKPYLPNMTFSGGSLVNSAGFYASTSGASGNNLEPYKNFDDDLLISDDFSVVRGNHFIKAGIYIERESKVENQAGYQYAGNFNFGSTTNNPLDTGDGYANALLGVFQSYLEASNNTYPNMIWWDQEGYVQDSWRVSRRLTLDLGVRFYHQGATSETSKSYSGFYPQLWNPAQAPRIYRPATVGGKSVGIDPVTGAVVSSVLVNTLVPGVGNPIDGMHVDGLTGKGDFYTTPLSFSPRIGFAWDPFGDGKTAIRGGFGTFYNLHQADLYSQASAPPPLYIPVVYYGYISQIPQAAASAAISPTVATGEYGTQPLERAHEWNLTFQRNVGFNTVVDVAYVGNFDRHASQTLSINPIPEYAYANPANLFNNTEINANLLRTAYPGMGALSYVSYSLSSLNYNALQVQAQRRLTHGLLFSAGYTFGKALGTQGWDAYHNQRQWFYGPISTDRSQVFTINYTYYLPNVGSHLGPAKHVLSNWALSGVTVFQTGAPITPSCSSTSSGPANSDPSLSGGGARCQEVADPNSFQHSFYTNFNTAAFTLASPGTFGNIGLGILRQPAWVNWDMTLNKRIPIGKSEKRVIRLGIQAYNVFNHTEFSSIGSTITLLGTTNTNTTTGQYTGTQSPRQMSTTLRFEF